MVNSALDRILSITVFGIEECATEKLIKSSQLNLPSYSDFGGLSCANTECTALSATIIYRPEWSLVE